METPQNAFNLFDEAMEEGPLGAVIIAFAHLVAVAGEEHPLVNQATNELVDWIDGLCDKIFEDEEFEDEEFEDEKFEDEGLEEQEFLREEEPSAYYLIVNVSIDPEHPLENLTYEEIMEMDFDDTLHIYKDMLEDVIGRPTDGHGVNMKGDANFEWKFETLEEAREARQLIKNDPRVSHLESNVRAY